MKNVILESLRNLSENRELNNYMFFQNVKTIRDAADAILNMNEGMVDMILSNGHDWASDHIATSKDDVEEVYNFLKKTTDANKDLKSRNDGLYKKRCHCNNRNRWFSRKYAGKHYSR